ncbi:hypothetical protein [Streptomyces endophyticus]|uniref:DUF3592 domain-containing protein n=1 Tax=Streptomyces endophyticus TaxID=714166 RepID=A0ABU6FMI6_9ACTN|nr:hypothetical protein [Streptomyces endophyticus]MEB8344071.1 hypothetical protein [Streptomyces endophyticus]
MTTEQVLRSRLTTARLRRGAVLLDRAGTGLSLRIPLTAIETVRPRGADGRRGIEIVLTAAPEEPDPATYRLRPSSRTAAKVFADAVNSALPVRDADQPRRSGRTAVSYEPRPPRGPRPPGGARWYWWAFGALFVLGICLTAATGESGLVIVWAASYAGFYVGCLITQVCWSIAKDWWVLRRSGITVEATYDRTAESRDSSGDLTSTKVYVFRDVGGSKHEYRGGGRIVARDPDRIEVTYDPLDEDRVNARRGLVARALLFLVFLLLGLPVCVLTVLYPVVFFVVAVAAF